MGNMLEEVFSGLNHVENELKMKRELRKSRVAKSSEGDLHQLSLFVDCLEDILLRLEEIPSAVANAKERALLKGLGIAILYIFLLNFADSPGFYWWLIGVSLIIYLSWLIFHWLKGDLFAKTKEVVKSAYDKEFIEHGSPYAFFNCAQNIYKKKSLQKISEAEFQEIRIFLTEALNHRRFELPSYRARAHRMLGEIADFHGDYPTAIDNYRKALSYDNKVGVKKALSKVEKMSQE